MDGSTSRPAIGADHDRIVEILVSSFYDDPTWRWVFPDDSKRKQQQRNLWSIFVAATLRNSAAYLTQNEAASTLWVPPGLQELSETDEDAAQRLFEDELGPDSNRIWAMFTLFDEAHPHDEPHYYLSFIGTHLDERGHGYGLGLLAQNLQSIDERHLPCYLEASNEVNVPLYSRFGFVVRDRFQPQPDGPLVTTMWRDAQ